ncbi:MAG TPA: peroxiredoxin, partial [Thermoanaerobaculia bacterium]|nr:peroxiredoxin [Thermoanaerobaculia bacterium]
MAISVGETIPNVTLLTMGADGPQPVSTAEVFQGKKVVLFAVPGAFTPTCSDHHLPSFVLYADQILAKGVDRIVCTAVNDVFVMASWGKARGVDEKILLLADGNGDFARALGLEQDLTRFGMGKRSQRYAALVENGVLRSLHVEAPG